MNRSGSGSFGGTRSTFGGTSSGSFSRSGSFNSSRGGISPGYTRSSNIYSYGGVSAPIRGYSGFHSSYYWGAPRWYYWTPFHPAWYYYPPVYSGGYYEPGGFHLFHFLLSIFLFFVFMAIIIRLFRGGGGGGVRYTTYN